MKTRNAVGILSLLFFFTATLMLHAQDNTRPAFITMTHTAWNFDLDDDTSSPKEWMDLSKEYNEKVTMKNEFVRGTVVLTHMYTGDNSDVILVTTYNSWEDIEKAQDRNSELEKAAWPDEAARNEFFKKHDRYYVHKHSDEIYVPIDGAKFPAEQKDTSRVIYIQKVYKAFPEDGSMEEYMALNSEYFEKVTHKNPHLYAFYPLAHAWGADNTEELHIYVLESMEDLIGLNRAWDALEEAAWPDEAERKAFFEKYDRYFTGRHGDYIYSSIAGVSK